MAIEEIIGLAVGLYFGYRIRKYIKNKKKSKNEMLWYARWYFSEIPKTGNIEVVYA